LSFWFCFFQELYADHWHKLTEERGNSSAREHERDGAAGASNGVVDELREGTEDGVRARTERVDRNEDADGYGYDQKHSPQAWGGSAAP